MIDAAEEVTGKKIKRIVGKRRPGDPPRLIASNAKATKELNWRPKYGDLKIQLEHAWKWHSKHFS